MVGGTGGVHHRQTFVGRAADALGLAPAAAQFGDGSHGFEQQQRRRAMGIHYRQQIKVLGGLGGTGPVGDADIRLSGLGAVQRLQPAQQLGLGLQPGHLGLARQLSLARRLNLLGRGRRRRLDPCRAIQQAQALVGGFQCQRHAVLALVANRAAAVTVPVCQAAVMRQLQLDRQLVGLTLAALYLAQQQPIAGPGLDVQALHLLVAVQHQTPGPGGVIHEPLQRAGVKPQTVAQHHNPMACPACWSAW